MISSATTKQPSNKRPVSRRARATSIVGASALLIAGCFPAKDAPDAAVDQGGLAARAVGGDVEQPQAGDQSAEQVLASSTAVSKEADLKKPMLTALSIVNPSFGNNEIKAKTNRSVAHELVRTAPSEYVLRLPGADVGEQISSSIMAQAGTGAIRSVRSVADKDGVNVRIFVTPESNLVVARNGDTLTVRDVGLSHPSDALAQAKQDAAPQKSGGREASAPTSEEAKSDTSAEEAVTQEADESIAKFLEEGPRFTGRLISLDLQDTDIDNALRIIAEVSNLNIIASEEVAGKVTLRLNDVPWDQALDVILKTNGLDKVQEGNVIRIAPFEKLRVEREGLKQAQQAAEEIEPTTVKYFRVSYAKASELKPLIDGVITERGQVSFDQRTNQVIIRDTQRGLKNSAQLIKTLDLRTPQVLLETQIVEARRNFLRNLGSQTGFRYVQAPEVGNATGLNFPNSVDIGGTITNAVTGNPNPIAFLFGSADGSRTLTEVLTAEETEGRVRVVSKPSVATLNNKPATIKSTIVFRIRIPQGGNVVSTGESASVTGGAMFATERIETGIILEVTPQASPDYFVLLDIKAKSSTLGAPAGPDNIPTEIERSTNSSVLVSSGQTFAMGGVYKVSEQASRAGLPWFKDLPILGTFFRRSGIDDSEEEILFFITPRIVEGSFDDATMKATL